MLMFEFITQRSPVLWETTAPLWIQLDWAGEQTLHEVDHEDAGGDGLGGDLDPPLEEEREQQHSDQTLPSQSCPGPVWFSFAESWP